MFISNDVGIPGWAVYCLTISATHLVQGITGFGAIALALPVLVLIFPLKTLVPALVAVNMGMCLWFAVRDRRHIRWRHVRSILLLSFLGMPIGFWIFSSLSPGNLKIGLGFIIILLAGWNLSGIRLQRSLPEYCYYLLNLVGGIAQGAFASGGPFVVIYTARIITDKTEFRATLNTVWLALNLFLCLSYTVTRAWSRPMLPLMGFAIPCLILGTVLGIVLHDRIPQKPFRTLVFSMLLVSGLILIRPLFF